MLRSTRVDIPAPIEARLKIAAGFVDNIMDFAREDLFGFRRPLAAVFAVVAPVAIALAYHTGGLDMAIKIGSSCGVTAGAGLYLLGRNQWGDIKVSFDARQLEKRRAKADLRCGFSEASSVELVQPPKFIEYEFGVLVLADAGDFKTLFFSINRDPADPRWRCYRRGELKRRVWRWMCLPVSREIIRFTTNGSPLKHVLPPSRISTIEAWEAVNVWLGEPADGAIIHQPFDQVASMVERLV